MKSHHGGGQPPSRMTLAQAEAQTARDRRKMIVFAIGAVLLFGAYLFSREARQDERQEQAQNAPPIGAPQDVVYTVPFQSEELMGAIEDATDEQRLVLSGEAIDALLKYSVALGPANYDALGARELNSTTVDELLAKPTELRADPYRVRGTVVRKSAIGSPDNVVRERQLAVIDLDGDQGLAHVAFLRPADDVEVGDFVRMDGMFAQIYTGATNTGLATAPLIVGNRLNPSTPMSAALAHEDLIELLRSRVQDDTVDDRHGEPEELWQLMAFARDRADEIDWKNAQPLDGKTLATIAGDGTVFRGQPFRIDVSQNMGTWTQTVGENPIRIDRVSRGWIGNNTWQDPAPLIQFVSPADLDNLRDYQRKRLVTGHAFFLKNVCYTRRDGQSTAMAPLFVVTSLEEFIPDEDPTPTYLMFGVFGGTILMIGLIFFLAKADSRSSKKLQEELVRRRRQRRTQAASSS